MPRAAVVLTVLLVSIAACGQANSPTTLTAEEIMARVGANQDRSEKLRAQYVYKQRVRIVSRQGNGKLRREETSQYDVVPYPEGMRKELTAVTGRYWDKGKYLDFTGKPIPEADSIDGNLVEEFRDEFTNDKTKDGISRSLFPLTSEEQKKYQFELLGEQDYQGRKVYRIGFRPKDKDDLTWAGEAYVDEQEFQPHLVFTKLSRNLPFWVRTLLGTNVPGLGFNVQYRRQPDGVWFPTSLGTEFRVRAVFFFKRVFFVSLENSAFERTHVDTKIKVLGFDSPQE